MIFCRVEQVSDRRHHISCPRSIHSEFRSREWNGRRLNNKKKKTSNKIMRSSWKTIFLWIHWVLWCINKNLGYQAILHRIHFLLPQIAIFHVFRAQCTYFTQSRSCFSHSRINGFQWRKNSLLNFSLLFRQIFTTSRTPFRWTLDFFFVLFFPVADVWMENLRASQ